MKAPITKTTAIRILWSIFFALFLFLFCGFLLIAYGEYVLFKQVQSLHSKVNMLTSSDQSLRGMIEKQSSLLLLSQNTALQDAQAELSKTQEDTERIKQKIQTLSQTVQTQSETQKDSIISSNDVTPFTSGVAQIICKTNTGIMSGSGSLISFKDIRSAVLTNYHVVKDADSCVLVMTNNGNKETGVFALKNTFFSFNKKTDAAILEIGDSLLATNAPKENYNYSITNTKTCTSPMPVGTPIVIIGYPAYAKRDTTTTLPIIGTVDVVYRTVTNGILSGYDTSVQGNPNYFVSAKIDNGNSGGIALAKDTSGICLLGVPTWLTVGKYETQGLVQNILNVIPAN